MAGEDEGSWHGVAPTNHGTAYIAAKTGMWKGGRKTLTFKARLECSLPAPTWR